MEKVLITGVAGFIGSHVADYCLKQGMEVVGVDDLSGGFKANIPQGVHFQQGSVTDADWVAGLWRGTDYDYVYHLAAYAAEGLSHFIRKFNYENNLIGSVNLINRAVKNKAEHFIFTSSIAVYGTNQVPMTESLAPEPKDPYGIAKYAVELDLQAAREMFGLNYTVFRPHNVYGERQNHGDPYRNVLGIFINNIMRGEPMPIFGDGAQTRAFTYIADVAPYIARAVDVKKAQNEVFNIGSDKAHSVLELAKKIAAAMGVKCDINFLPARNETVHAFSGHEKFESVFGGAKKTGLDEGIKRMVKWVKKTGPRSAAKFKNIELTENMPPSWRKLTAKGG